MNILKRLARKMPFFYHLTRCFAMLEEINSRLESADTRLRLIRELMAERYIDDMIALPKYHEPGKLNWYERQVYSQNGEDGIILIGNQLSAFIPKPVSANPPAPGRSWSSIGWPVGRDTEPGWRKSRLVAYGTWQTCRDTCP